MIGLKNVTFIVIILCVTSCALLSSGYSNKYNQFVPKNENFELKDKKGGQLLPQLDTVNIYIG